MASLGKIPVLNPTDPHTNPFHGTSNTMARRAKKDDGAAVLLKAQLRRKMYEIRGKREASMQ